MEQREPQLGAAVGKKGVGKSYQTERLIEWYVSGQGEMQPRKVLIMDANDEYDRFKSIPHSYIGHYAAHPKIDVRRLRPFNADGSKMTISELQELMYKAVQEFQGGLLLLEDLNKYVADTMPMDLIGAICTNRHSDLDIIMHFQSVGRITSKVWQNLNWVRFHKNTDSVKRHKQKFQDKYELLSIVEIIVNTQYNNGNKRFFCYVDVEEMKLSTQLPAKIIEQAVREFIQYNTREVLRPVLERRDGNGAKMFSQAEAYEVAVEMLKNKYFID